MGITHKTEDTRQWRVRGPDERRPGGEGEVDRARQRLETKARLRGSHAREQRPLAHCAVRARATDSSGPTPRVKWAEGCAEAEHGSMARAHVGPLRSQSPAVKTRGRAQGGRSCAARRTGPALSARPRPCGLTGHAPAPAPAPYEAPPLRQARAPPLGEAPPLRLAVAPPGRCPAPRPKGRGKSLLLVSRASGGRNN